jgi:hypothetical protein
LSSSTNENEGATAVDYLLDCLYRFGVGFVGGAVLFVLGGIAFGVLPFIFNNIGNPIARGLGRAARLVYRNRSHMTISHRPETKDAE